MSINTNLIQSAREKPVVVAGIALLVVILLLAGVKGLQIITMIAAGKSFTPPPETVTTTRVQLQAWEKTLSSVGSLTAVNGVTISAEQNGNIERIAFTPGSTVAEGDLLVQQDISTEDAQLRAALATAELAKINLKRSQELISKKLTSQSDYDAAAAQYKGAIAQADNIRSLIEKKTIRAPFAGKVGTQKVFVGQYLQAGETIVSLQSLDPMYVNFKLPQQELAQIKNDLVVKIESDAVPGGNITGVITAIDPEVDANTRNAAIQATVRNPDQQLLPGMFVNVSIVMSEQQQVFSVPATAIVYAPYGASVFVVDQKQNEKTGANEIIARQQFVKLGQSRGDYVAVTSGLKDQDLIVSTGAFKLHNGQSIVENNKLAPEFELNPQPEDS
ncbi:MAG: efflux RND transporter periplasmic adaptor subunit [Gammaproteobacteria bacterium]|nr:efflux RND transporter periplasmic adaptor subunit [Gammaproteobacteria bacterium]